MILRITATKEIENCQPLKFRQTKTNLTPLNLGLIDYLNKLNRQTTKTEYSTGKKKDITTTTHIEGKVSLKSIFNPNKKVIFDFKDTFNIGTLNKQTLKEIKRCLISYKLAHATSVDISFDNEKYSLPLHNVESTFRKVKNALLLSTKFDYSF